MTISERRQRETQQRRRTILAAARDLFGRQGFAATTIEQVAARAELAQGTIYLYFPSKHALYVELLIEGFDTLREHLLTAAAGPGQPRPRAAAVIDAFYNFARSNPAHFDILFFVLQRESVAAWRGKLPDDLLARLAEKEDACKQIAAAFLQQAHYAPDESLPATIEAAWAMLAGVIFYLRDDDLFPQAAQAARQLLLNAIFGRQE